MASKYDYVKGYKCKIDQMPKELRSAITKKFQKENPKLNIYKHMLEVDVYYSVDIKNFYKRSD